MLFPNTSLYIVHKKTFILPAILWESLSVGLEGFRVSR